MIQTRIVAAGDLHWRITGPRCRTDQFHDTLSEKLQWIFDMALDFDAPVVFPGDLFHEATPGLLTVNSLIEEFSIASNVEKWGCAGNHDLPGHTMDNFGKSGLWTLTRAEFGLQMKAGQSISFSKDVFDRVDNTVLGERVYCVHAFLYDKAPVWEVDPRGQIQTFAKGWAPNTVVVCGDNHKRLVYYNEKLNVLVLNMGSVARMSADQMDHKPAIAMVTINERKSGTIDDIDYVIEEIPIENDVWDTGVLEAEHRKDEAAAEIQELVDKFRELEGGSLDFRVNLERVLKERKPSSEVLELVKGVVE